MAIRKRNALWGIVLLCLLGAGGFFAHHFLAGGAEPVRAGTESSSTSFEWLIEPRLERAYDFTAKVTWVQEEPRGPWKLIGVNGKVIVNSFDASFIHPYDEVTGLALYDKDYLEGYVDLEGRIAIPPEFDIARSFHDGVAVVRKNDFYGVIDRDAELVLPISYTYVTAFDARIFAVQEVEDGKYGYITAGGEMLSDYVFDIPSHSLLPSGVYLAVLGGKCGLINAGGDWILPASYDFIYRAIEEPIGVLRNGKVGFVDAEGKVVIDFQYGELGPAQRACYTFSDGLAVVLLPDRPADSRWGVIDSKGNLLFCLPGLPQARYNEGFILVKHYKTDDYGLVDREGKWFPLPPDVGMEYPESGLVCNGILRVKTMSKTSKYEKDKYGYLKIR